MKWYVSAPFRVTVCCFGVLRGSVTLKSRAEGLCTFGKCGAVAFPKFAPNYTSFIMFYWELLPFVSVAC